MQEEYQEKYATILIKNLEDKVENELFPAAFSICDRIEKEGKKEFEAHLNQFISTKCPLRRCTVLMGEPSKCPIPLCWIAEGPTWPEFLLPEINAVYSMLMDIYTEALDIPEAPDEEITLREKPLNVMDRKLKTKGTQNFIIEAFKKSQILKLRTPIIKDILWAHTKGRYTLSVPLLVIQIEGILHDLAYHFKWKFTKEEMYGGESARVWVIIKKLGDKSFENTLGGFYTRKTSSEEAPRNLILHGRSVDYGKDHRLSSVLFLILIYLITFSQIKIQGRITIE
jgi:hypothetical protein